MEVTPTLVTRAFESHPIRCFDLDDVMEWVAADVCAAVQLSGSAIPYALERLAPDDLGTRTASILGTRQKLVTVTEAGLYQLLCHCDKQIAKRFKRWLCREVIQLANSSAIGSNSAKRCDGTNIVVGAGERTQITRTGATAPNNCFAH